MRSAAGRPDLVVVNPMRAQLSLAFVALMLLGTLASLPIATSATLGACSTQTVPNPRPAGWYVGNPPPSAFADSCYHQFLVNAPDSARVDVLIAPPAGPLPLRDISLLRQSVQMWKDGIHDMAEATGRPWLAAGLDIHAYVVGVDAAQPGYQAALRDPEVIILTTDALADAYAGVGTDLPASLCAGLPDPAPTSAQVAALPGYDDHHGRGVGTYSEECANGGRVCVVANNAMLGQAAGNVLLETPDEALARGLYDLDSHEFGHCLGLGHVGDANDFGATAYPRDDIMSYENEKDANGLSLWDPPYALCVSNLDVKTLAYVYQPLVPGAPDRDAGLLGGYMTMEGGRDPWAPGGDGPTPWRVVRSDGTLSTTAADCPQPDADLLASPLEAEQPGGGGPVPPSLAITAPADNSSFARLDSLAVTGTYDCGDSCMPSPLTGEAHVYQGGFVDPFANAPDQTTVVAGTPVGVEGRFIKSTSEAYPLRAGQAARVTLHDAAGSQALVLASSPLDEDAPTGSVDSDPDDFATHADWTVPADFPAGDYTLAIEVGGFGAGDLWWGLPSLPVRVVGASSAPAAASASPLVGPLPPFLFDAPAAPSSLSPQSRESGWRDPAAGGNGDYVFIDSPASGSAASGTLPLSGRAGTSPTDPDCTGACGGGGGNGTTGHDFSGDSQVVIAVIDTGANPYHTEFRDATRLQPPSKYLSGFPADADGVRLCFVDEPSAGQFAYDDHCPASWSAARAADAPQWATIPAGKLVWFPGTRMMGISFAHDGQPGYNILDATRDPADASDTHGSWTTSTAAGKTAGTCPGCLVVIIEADSVDAIDQGYLWAAQQPWIDVITSSVSSGLIGLGWNPGAVGEAVWGDGASTGARTAVQNGKLFFEAAGNGLANAGLVPTSTWLLQSSNPYTVAVGASNENTGEAAAYYDLPVQVLGTGHDRRAATPGTMGSFESVAGTSFASPSAAGVAASALLSARAAVGDAVEGATPAGGSLTLLRDHDGVAVAQGPFENGVLTLDEFREAVLKNAQPAFLPGGSHCLGCYADTPASFVLEGYGALNAGYSGSGSGAGTTRAAPIANTILGHAPLPSRPEAQAWTDAVQAVNEQWWGASRPAMDGDGDAFPRTDYLDCPDCSIPEDSAALSLFTGLRSARTPEQLGDALAAHGVLSGLSPGAPVPAPAPAAHASGASAAGGCANVCVRVNGADVGNATIAADGTWRLDVDLSASTAPYMVYVWHGTANDTASYVAPGPGGDGAPVVTLAADRTGVAPGGSVTFTATARHDFTSEDRAPTAAFTATANRLSVYLNGTLSSDPDGDALSYAWDFGDGVRGTGPAVWHDYAASGTYAVRLTVDDGRGGSASTAQNVTVSSAPSGPHSILVLDDPASDSVTPLGDIVRVSAGIDPDARTVTVLTTFEPTALQPVGAQARNEDAVVGEWYFNGVNYEAWSDGSVYNYATGVAEPGMGYVSSGDQIRLTITSASPVYGAIAGGSVDFAFGSNLGQADLLSGFVPDDRVPDAGTVPLRNAAIALTVGRTSASGPCVPAPCRSGAGNETVTIYVDGAPQHVESFSRAQEGPGGYAVQYSHAFTGNGTHSVEAVFTDDQGVRAKDGPVNVTVAPQADQAPRADAGPDQSVEEGTVVTLAGSGTDADGQVVAYAWRQLTGPAVSIANRANSTVRFAAPDVDADTTLLFSLTVTDDQGATGSDNVTVTVHPAAHAGNVVEVVVEGHRARTALPPRGGNWSVTLTGLGDLSPGYHLVTATAYDGSGSPIASDRVAIRVESPDSDGDGVADAQDNCPSDPNPDQKDLDGDGTGDVCDVDLDGDGVKNAYDAFPDDPHEWADSDGDGVGDNGDAFPDDPTQWADVDGDGDGDNGDICPGSPNSHDADGDGIPDGCDLCPTAPGGCEGDADGDNVRDAADNCVDAPNPDQKDLDRDRRGDACDNDRDGDGYSNGRERAFGTNPDDPASHP